MGNAVNLPPPPSRREEIISGRYFCAILLASGRYGLLTAGRVTGHRVRRSATIISRDGVIISVYAVTAVIDRKIALPVLRQPPVLVAVLDPQPRSDATGDIRRAGVGWLAGWLAAVGRSRQYFFRRGFLRALEHTHYARRASTPPRRTRGNTHVGAQRERETPIFSLRACRSPLASLYVCVGARARSVLFSFFFFFYVSSLIAVPSRRDAT